MSEHDEVRNTGVVRLGWCCPKRSEGRARCSASLISSAFPSENTNMHSIITRYERLGSPPNGYLLHSECGLTARRPRDQEVGYRWTLDSWLSQARPSPPMSLFCLRMAVRGQPALETKPWGWMGKLLAASFSVGAKRGAMRAQLLLSLSLHCSALCISTSSTPVSFQ